MSNETEYHRISSCNNCGEGTNDVETVDTINGDVCEAKTKCESCGHLDYWAYGFFESGQEMESNCKKYTWR